MPDTTTIASVPYAWPYHGALNGARLAAVVLRQPAWRPLHPTPVDDRTSDLVHAARAAGALTIAVVGAGGASPVQAGQFDAVLPAPGTGAFFASALDLTLRRNGRTDVILAGWGLEGPVHSTLREANDRGYECLLVPDACTPVDDSLVHAACSTVMHSGGIFGAFAPLDDVLSALAVLPGHPSVAHATRSSR